jgi:hypothetical protein
MCLTKLPARVAGLRLRLLARARGLSTPGGFLWLMRLAPLTHSTRRAAVPTVSRLHNIYRHLMNGSEDATAGLLDACLKRADTKARLATDQI